MQTMLAYLVIREGTKWTDVFRLTPGRTVTIGRGSTNEIVIKDERCSRNHAEVFLTSGEWTIRDLESRNGTIVRGQAIHGDYALSAGDVIKIAHCQLAFVHDLSKAFVDVEDEPPSPDGRETVSGAVYIGLSDSHVLDSFEPTHITHRRGQTKFLERKFEVDVASVPKVGQAATKLCRLAFELANQTDVIASRTWHLTECLKEPTSMQEQSSWAHARSKRAQRMTYSRSSRRERTARRDTIAFRSFSPRWSCAMVKPYWRETLKATAR